MTFATDRPGGFDEAHIAGLLKLLPVLALVSEIRIKNRLARTLLETYVGSHAGELILAGATRRGSGTTVRAAIMICDLRDFTRIYDNWPRDDVIDLLNGYFDVMSEPIARHGGEILKFIGDGLLAIFPLSQPSACANLLHAVAEARQAMTALNEKNSETGRAPLNQKGNEAKEFFIADCDLFFISPRHGGPPSARATEEVWPQRCCLSR